MPDALARALGHPAREQAITERVDDATDLDVRMFRFSCGCTAERLREVIRASEDLDDLFGGAESIEVLCPRCGHQWRLTRADLDH